MCASDLTLCERPSHVSGPPSAAWAQAHAHTHGHTHSRHKRILQRPRLPSDKHRYTHVHAHHRAVTGTPTYPGPPVPRHTPVHSTAQPSFASAPSGRGHGRASRRSLLRPCAYETCAHVCTHERARSLRNPADGPALPTFSLLPLSPLP